ncbi:DUF397 domain-containing protein [Streptomyces sp. TR02-1]|uniref:DUF397 domain-containing protein n=1 Tax=Streptomyces sp. TR02-1 TaxID=3385977 RepID=UPI00399F24ED
MRLKQDGWFTSSHSGTANGECISVAFLSDDLYGVRDSKTPGPELRLSQEAFTSLVDYARNTPRLLGKERGRPFM